MLPRHPENTLIVIHLCRLLVKQMGVHAAHWKLRGQPWRLGGLVSGVCVCVGVSILIQRVRAICFLEAAMQDHRIKALEWNWTGRNQVQ